FFFFFFFHVFLVFFRGLLVGIFISTRLPVAIHVCVIWMMLLVVLLALQILTADWVNPGGYVLIRYMALLFVPIGVGVMKYFALLREQFGPVVVSCAVST
ncbi:CidA/LrgA family protein, partial [Escherichia coli]|uniref:CidA/LrgA family protein n=1 Tax=Escherichia coli TaxID=562 RepID=UPI0010CBCF67